MSSLRKATSRAQPPSASHFPAPMLSPPGRALALATQSGGKRETMALGFTYGLELQDGTPADPPVLHSTISTWQASKHRVTP
jgi:hypothetical protein